MAKITVGILGLGTVGTGVLELLRADPRFRVKWVAVRDKTKPRNIDLTSIRVTDQPFDVVEDPEVEIVIEVAGGITPTYEVVRRALERGKQIVTANKELIAKHGAELFDLAQRNYLTILFEAAVGGGIPLISTLQRGLKANRISRVAGILNGTSNYILTMMGDRGLEFDTALEEARQMGLTEADPTDDVEGFDVAYKITILASLAFGGFVDCSSIYRQGISRVADVDIRTALEFGYRIKMIGLAERVGNTFDIRAHPMLVPRHHPLASVDGLNNAILINGTVVGEIMLVGPGAGQMPTASAVVGDVINIASASSVPDFSPYFQPAIVPAQLSVRPIEEAESAFYIRLQTADTPGVMGNVGRAFGAHGVSMHSIIQRGMPGTDGATVTLLTYRTPEGRVARALEDIRTQTTTRAIAVALRVFEGK